jgi:quinol monooxygenase YgiN
MDKVSVVARISAAPGRRDELAGELQVVLDTVESEPGTLYYVLHADDQDADVLWVYELYVDRASLQAHLGGPWFAELVGKLGPLLAGPPTLHFMTVVGGKGLDRFSR